MFKTPCVLAKRLRLLIICSIVSATAFTQNIDGALNIARQKHGGQLIKIDSVNRVWTKKLGSGKIKVLLIPGGPGYSHQSFYPMGETFPAEGIEIYFYDPIDVGLSDRTGDTTKWNINSYVEHIETIRKALKLDRFYILGVSFGGAVAMEYAYKYPDQLNGLIVSNMNYSMDRLDARLEELVRKNNPYLDRLFKQIDNPGSLDSISMLQLSNKRDSILHDEADKLKNIEKWHPRFSRIQPPKDLVLEPVFDQAANVYMQFVKSGEFLYWDFTSKLGKVITPTLIITGDKDYALSPEDARFMQQHMPNASAIICKDGTHHLAAMDVDCYHAGIIAFLKKVHQRINQKK